MSWPTDVCRLSWSMGDTPRRLWGLDVPHKLWSAHLPARTAWSERKVEKGLRVAKPHLPLLFLVLGHLLLAPEPTAAGQVKPALPLAASRGSGALESSARVTCSSGHTCLDLRRPENKGLDLKSYLLYPVDAGPTQIYH